MKKQQEVSQGPFIVQSKVPGGLTEEKIKSFLRPLVDFMSKKIISMSNVEADFFKLFFFF